jgi:sugar transferase (PEP-CTERM system associated)
MGTVRLFNHPIKKLYLLLISAEAALLFASTYLGVYLRYLANPDAILVSVGPIGPRAVLITLVMMLSLTAVGLYNRWLRDPLEGILVRLCLGFALGTVVLTIIFYVWPEILLGRGAFALTLLSAFVLLTLSRAIFLKLLAQQNIHRRVLVLGAGRRARPLLMLRRRSDLIGASVVGYMPLPGDDVLVPERRLIRSDKRLSQLVADERVDEIVVAVDDRRQGLPMDELLRCRTQGVQVIDVLSFLEQETGKIKIDLLYPSWLAFSEGFRRGLLRGVAKRSFDIVVSLGMLIVALPIMALAALAILIEDGFRGPVLYRQRRVGEGGREFDVYKFRSMRTDAEKDGQARWAQTNDPRVTRVGAFIRTYRVDELPQIFNVLRGDMSFVGPRPERPQFVQGLQEKIPYYAERHQVKPGLTGWAQICYPYGASDKDAFEKLQYDLYYVKNHSLFLDLTILLQTAEVVLWGKGAR